MPWLKGHRIFLGFCSLRGITSPLPLLYLVNAYSTSTKGEVFSDLPYQINSF